MYKLWRNRVLKLIRKAKSTFYIHEIERNKSDPRKLWKLVNELAPKKTHTTPTILEVGENVITDKHQVADAFNNFFTNVASSIRDTDSSVMPNSSYRIIEDFVSTKLDKNTKFEIPFLNKSQVLNLLQDLNETKSTGPDLISSRILKISAEKIAPSLTKICKFSILKGIFPTRWKEANVCPIYKGGDVKKCSNYRPGQTQLKKVS